MAIAESVCMSIQNIDPLKATRLAATRIRFAGATLTRNFIRTPLIAPSAIHRYSGWSYACLANLRVPCFSVAGAAVIVALAQKSSTEPVGAHPPGKLARLRAGFRATANSKRRFVAQIKQARTALK